MKNKTWKKLALSFATATVVFTPAIVLVSCSQQPQPGPEPEPKPITHTVTIIGAKQWSIASGSKAQDKKPYTGVFHYNGKIPTGNHATITAVQIDDVILLPGKGYICEYKGNDVILNIIDGSKVVDDVRVYIDFALDTYKLNPSKILPKEIEGLTLPKDITPSYHKELTVNINWKKDVEPKKILVKEVRCGLDHIISNGVTISKDNKSLHIAQNFIDGDLTIELKLYYEEGIYGIDDFTVPYIREWPGAVDYNLEKTVSNIHIYDNKSDLIDFSTNWEFEAEILTLPEYMEIEKEKWFEFNLCQDKHFVDFKIVDRALSCIKDMDQYQITVMLTFRNTTIKNQSYIKQITISFSEIKNKE